MDAQMDAELWADCNYDIFGVNSKLFFLPTFQHIDKQLSLFKSSHRALLCDVHIISLQWVIQPRRMAVNLDARCIHRAHKVSTQLGKYSSVSPIIVI